VIPERSSTASTGVTLRKHVAKQGVLSASQACTVDGISLDPCDMFHKPVGALKDDRAKGFESLRRGNLKQLGCTVSLPVVLMIDKRWRILACE